MLIAHRISIRFVYTCSIVISGRVVKRRRDVAFVLAFFIGVIIYLRVSLSALSQMLLASCSASLSVGYVVIGPKTNICVVLSSSGENFGSFFRFLSTQQGKCNFGVE